MIGPCSYAEKRPPPPVLMLCRDFARNLAYYRVGQRDEAPLRPREERQRQLLARSQTARELGCVTTDAKGDVYFRKPSASDWSYSLSTITTKKTRHLSQPPSQHTRQSSI